MLLQLRQEDSYENMILQTSSGIEAFLFLQAIKKKNYEK